MEALQKAKDELQTRAESLQTEKEEALEELENLRIAQTKIQAEAESLRAEKAELQTELNKATSDIIAVYVYEQGIINAKYSYSTAVGLFNTVVNIILLIIVNRIAKKAADVSFV